MDYIEAAAYLGQSIAESGIFVELKTAEKEMLADSECTQILYDYRQFQQTVANGVRDDVSKEELEDVRTKLLEKQKEVNANPMIKRYLTAKRAFDGMMEEVNSVIRHYTEGDPGECTGSCETCGGCS